MYAHTGIIPYRVGQLNYMIVDLTFNDLNDTKGDCILEKNIMLEVNP